MQTNSKDLLSLIVLLLFSFFSITICAQSPQLKHSYSFDDGTPTDMINGADGILHGAFIQNGSLVASEEGHYLELPAEKINISSYKSLSLEAFIKNSQGNGVYTMFAYFGDVIGNLGCDYLFQSLFNGGESKTAITCKNKYKPWATESSVRSILLEDTIFHHVVTTFDNKYLRFYIDGVLTGVDSVSQFPHNNISNIGNQVAWLCKGGYRSDPSWKGSIDKFNIYEGILDSTHIVQTAQKYVPGLNLTRMQKLLRSPTSSIVVDDWEKFEHPLTGNHIFFMELSATEKDSNNFIDEVLTFSDVPMNEWSDFSSAVRLSNLSGYLDVWNSNGHCYADGTKTPVEIGQVYQCWIQLNIPENIYSLYAKTIDKKKPKPIWTNAQFRKKVTELTYWSAVHNKELQNDAMKVKSITQVDQIGDFPKDYKASVPKIKKSVFDEKAPKGSLVVENPQHGAQSGKIEVKRLVLTDSATNLFLRLYHTPTSWVYIPENIYIQQSGNKEKLYIQNSKGIPIGMKYYASAKGFSDVQITFPPIDRYSTTFSFKEEQGNWFIYDIQLKSAQNTDKNLIYGNWYNTNTGDWLFSLLDTIVIYKNCIWEYDNFNPSKKKGNITLTCDDTSITLNYKWKGEQIFIGESNECLRKMDPKSRYSSVENPINPPSFEKPILKPGTTVIKGYCYGFSKEIPNKTATLHVDNILTGEQSTHLLKLEDDGTFYIELPTNHPQEIYVRMKGFAPQLFIEPGKEIFVLLNLKENNAPLIMGPNVRLMDELQRFGWNYYYMSQFYQEIYNIILDMSPEEYKFFCMMKKEEDLKNLDNLVKQHHLSDRYNQVLKENIVSYYNRNVLYYSYYSRNAYKRKHNIPDSQRNLPVVFNVPSDPEFYDYLKPDYMNNELSLLGNFFSNLVNALRYSPILQTHNNYIETLKDFDGIAKLDDNEKKLVHELKEYISAEYLKLKQDFSESVGDTEGFIIKKYQKEYNEIIAQDKKEWPMFTLVKKISESDTISINDQEYCKKAFDYYSHPVVIKALTFMIENRNKLWKLYNKYPVYSKIAAIEKRNIILAKDLGIGKGLVGDICTSQDVLNNIVSQLTPLEDELLMQYQNRISHHEITAYIADLNKSVQVALEANKAKGGYSLNDVPKTEADRLFDTIISHYSGKVVYVDFWATWCGPCRRTMQQHSPLKEAYKDKDVVFVYITNPSSPEKTYNNMIPNIKGEHYRVSRDEWNYLTEKFNIKGIPHYVIVNKEGVVIDKDAPRDPALLMKAFDELLKK